MGRMLICPKCGLYQEDTTAVRKAGVAAKKTALFAGQQAFKYAAKFAVSSVGLDGETAQRAAGMAGSEIAKFVGLDPKKASISDVKYKCSSCTHYWEGLDEPELLNQMQLNTVAQEHESSVNIKKGSFSTSLINTLFSIVFGVLAFWIWSERSSTTVTNSFLGFTSTSTDYSWHYYIFWPMIVIVGFWFLMAICSTFANYIEYKELKDKSDLDYAREYMNLMNT